MTTGSSNRSVRDRLSKRLRTVGTPVGITIGPAVVWLALFVLVPLLFLIAVSFTTTDQQFNIIWQPTVSNYKDLLGGEGIAIWRTPFGKALLLSYAIAIATTITTLLVAFPAAYLLSKRSGRFVKVTMFFLLVPFFSVYIVRIYAWFTVFGQNGAANNILLSLGLINEPLAVFNYGIFPTIVSLTHAFVPYMLLTLYATLDGVDFSLTEAARDLGATRLGAFRDVVLPLISSGIVTGCVFVFVPALGAYLAPQLLGRGQFYMIGQMVVTRIYTQYSIGYGSTMAIFIVIAIIATIIVLYRVSGVRELVRQ